MTAKRVVFVHGACVRDGAWWWHPTAERLQAAGVRSAAALLPSCGEGPVPPGAAGPGLPEDVASVRALLEAEATPTVVVAHSYGGIVTAQAAVGVAAVRHLLLISSYLARAGESLSTFSSEAPAPYIDVDPAAGTLSVRAELLVETFLQDCRELADEAVARLARQSLHVTQQRVEEAVWGPKPTTYLVCAQDLGTSAERQREFARRAERVLELEAGHHPFLSQPADVADLVLGLF
jgi:pimeloyl-ACP methyl ester carboxylesterase